MHRFQKVDKIYTRSGWLGIFLAVILAACSGSSGQTPVPADKERLMVGDGMNAVEPAVDHEVTSAAELTLARDEENRLQRTVYYYLLGRLFLDDHQWNLAEELFSRAVEADPKAIKPRLHVAHLATQRGDLKKAARYAAEALEHNPDHQRARILLAGILTAIKEYPQAVRHYEILLKKDPEHTQSRFLLAQLYGRLGDIKKVRKTLAPLMKDKEQAWRAQLAIGRAMISQNDLKGALKPFQKAKRLAPDQLEVILALGSVLQLLERPNDAKKVYKDYLKDNPESTTIHSRLGRLLLTQDDRKAALEEFETITRIAPDSVQARMTTALIELSEGNHEKALQDLRLLEMMHPDNAVVSYYLGQALEGMERMDEAIKAYEKVPEKQTFYGEAQLRISFLEAEQGTLATAIKRLKRLEKVQPKWPELYLAQSFLMLQDKDFKNVIEVATRGLTMKPLKERLYFNRAMAYDKLDRWPDAEADLRAYLEKSPNDAHALNYLGYTWADRNENLEESYKLLKRASELAPNDGFIVDSLGWVLFRLKRLDESLKMIKRAVKMEPKDPTVNEHMGDILQAMGRTREALTIWKRALELDNKNAMLRKKIQRHSLELDADKKPR